MAALEAGKLPGLVNASLVRHRVAIQGSSPPLLPTLSIDCGGFITRIGLDEDAMSEPPNIGHQSTHGDLSRYEFTFCVAALHGVPPAPDP